MWSLGVAVWEMTAAGALPYGEQQRSTRACVQPIVAQQLQLKIDGAWGGPRARRAGRSDDTDSGGVGVSDIGLSINEAERQLSDMVRRVVRLCLTYDVHQRPDSPRLARTVEQWWAEWKEKAGEGAAAIERAWVQYHEVVQQRLGPPVSRAALTATPVQQVTLTLNDCGCEPEHVGISASGPCVFCVLKWTD